ITTGLSAILTRHYRYKPQSSTAGASPAIAEPAMQGFVDTVGQCTELLDRLTVSWPGSDPSRGQRREQVQAPQVARIDAARNASCGIGRRKQEVMPRRTVPHSIG